MEQLTCVGHIDPRAYGPLEKLDLCGQTVDATSSYFAARYRRTSMR